MHRERRPDPRPPDRLGDNIANASIRGYYDEILSHLNRLHDNVEVFRSDIDVRTEFDGRLICRIVPYRELLHLQIGDSPTWEIRIRDEEGFIEAMGRILETFLRLAAEDRGAVRARAAPQSGVIPR